MFTLALLIPLHGFVMIGIVTLLFVLAIPDIKEHARNIRQIFKKTKT